MYVSIYILPFILFDGQTLNLCDESFVALFCCKYAFIQSTQNAALNGLVFDESPVKYISTPPHPLPLSSAAIRRVVVSGP